MTVFRAMVFVALLGGASASAQTDAASRAAALGELDRVSAARSAAVDGGDAPAVPRFGDTAYRHRGFYVRPDLGAGYLAVTQSTPLGKLKSHGVAGMFGLHVGGAIEENALLGVHLFTSGLKDPQVTLGGASEGGRGTTIWMLGIGPEITWYVMPANVYVSATAALTQLRADVDGEKSTTDFGFGTRLAVGKEWWMSHHWGVGLAGQFTWARNQGRGEDADTVRTWGLGLALSATYN